MLNTLKNKLNQEKGFTLVEILVVIVIIGILFTVVLPRIDFASDKAKETGVRKDFNDFTSAFDMAMKTSSGNIDFDDIHEWADGSLHLAVNKTDTTGTAEGTTISTAGQSSTTPVYSLVEDPWEEKYHVYVSDFSGAKSQIIVHSIGKSGDISNPDYGLATYYKNGEIETCSWGLGDGTELVKFSGITCGDDIINLP